MVTHAMQRRHLGLAIFALFAGSAGLAGQPAPAAQNSAAPSAPAGSASTPSPSSVSPSSVAPSSVTPSSITPPSLNPSSLNPTSAKEFPVSMKQDVTAGKTPVGTKVQARLQVATLVDGTVFPKNTIFSGEVTESVAKSDNSPSRIGIRMDSAQWKDGSAPIRIYLTAWFYPLIAAGRGQDLSYGPPQSATQTWNGAGTYPDPGSPASQPFPGQDMSRSAGDAPEPPVYVLSKRRFLMKDVDSERSSSGAVAISSRRFNIKLDKSTTYVMATDDLVPRKPGD